MKSFTSLCIAVLLALTSCSHTDNHALAEKILSDTLMTRVEDMAVEMIMSGYNAGTGYAATWIRDFYTLEELALDHKDHAEIEDVLVTFMEIQGEDGNIPDGYRFEDGERVAHKNTIETDQESSFILAVCLYVDYTGNKEFLSREVCGMTVTEHMEAAINYLLTSRYDSAHGLIWGGTTADWGDVQPENEIGVLLDEDSHYSLDIYDNAMLICALNAFSGLLEDSRSREHWCEVRDGLARNVKKYLWDAKKQKYHPHVYLSGSPFPEDFDEEAIYYHGGTSIAMTAGLLTGKQVYDAYRTMKANQEAIGAHSIGLTMYPAYPTGYFKHPILTEAYTYQNGGDWTWFGARTIKQLARYGYVEEAYEELRPMLERVVEQGDFYEWYSLAGEPRGSACYRGTAGVLYEAIKTLRAWAEENR